MGYKIVFGVLLLLLFGGAQAQNEDVFLDQVMVQLVGDDEALMLLKDINADLPGAKLAPRQHLSEQMHIWLLEFDETEVDKQTILLAVNRHPAVIAAQYNHRNLELRATPNDLDFLFQWGLHNDGVIGGFADIEAKPAWDITTGGPTAKGDTIVVAVIDGGTDIDHADLHIFTNHQEIPGNSFDDDNNGYIDDYQGWNAYANNGAVPDHQHGAHVTGIVGAKGNNSLGVTGVSWDVQVLPVAGSSTNEATVVAAYDYVLKMRTQYNQSNGAEGAYIVAANSSFGVNLGQPANFPIWCAMYDSLGAQGVISVGATANQAVDVDAVGDIPTACPSDFLLSVTNMTFHDTLNGGAAWGDTTIDVGAPGTSIFSTRINSDYGFSTGTSMATPHVSGTVALMYSALCEATLDNFAGDPEGLATYVRSALLAEGFDVLPSLQGLTATSGRLNAFKSVLSVLADSCAFLDTTLAMPSCGNCDGSITVEVFGGTPPFTYLWDDQAAQTTATAGNLCVGIYHATVTDFAGNVYSREFTLNNPGSPNVNIVVLDTKCADSDDGIASGSDASRQYVWSTGDTTLTKTQLAVGAYQVTVTNTSNGCASVYGFEIASPTPIVVSAAVTQESSFSAGDGEIEASATGGIPSYIYEWNTGSLNALITGLTAGTYTVTVTDSNKCKMSESYLIGPPVGLVTAKEATATWQIFPNPASDEVTVGWYEAQAGEYELALTDITGRKVWSQQLVIKETAASLRLQLPSNLASGMYTFSIQWGEGRENKLLLIQERK